MEIVKLFSTVVYALASLLLGISLIQGFSRLLKQPQSGYISVRLASGFLLGQSILANIWIFLGLLAWFKVFVIWAVLIITILFGGWYAQGIIREFAVAVREITHRFKSLTVIWKFAVLSLFLLIGLYGIGAIVLHPFSDAEAFYMVLPKIMAASERLTPQPNYYAFSQIGFSGEMHFAALMAIGSVPSAKLYVWFTAGVLAMFVVALCSQCSIRFHGKCMALGILFTSSTVTLYIMDGKVDIFGSALGIAAYYWAFCTKKTTIILPWILTGLFAGFAFIAKMSNIPTILPGICLILLWNLILPYIQKPIQVKTILSRITLPCLIIGGGMLLAILPHFIKNGVLFGEPFAPFVFLHPTGNTFLEQSWYDPKLTRYMLFTYPLALILGNYPMQCGNLSILLLAFCPCIFFLRRPNSFFKSVVFQMTIAGAIGMGVWMILRPSVMAPRYTLATLLLFIPLVAKGVEYVLDCMVHYRMFRYVLLGAFFFVVFGTLDVYISKFILKNVSVLLTGTIQERDALPEFNAQFRASLGFLNQQAMLGDRIYLLGYYAYYLRPDLLQCLHRSDEIVTSPQAETRNIDDIWESLYDRGFTYIAIQKGIGDAQWEKWSDSAHLPSWLRIEKMFDDPNSSVYKIISMDSQRIPHIACQQIHPPAWDIIEVQ